MVEPIDDFRDTNPATNPPLLDALARDFAAQNFSLRGLVRRIVLSRTYQLASEPNATNADDERNFSHALVRRLSAEQLLDAAHRVAGVEPKFNGYPPGVGPTQVPGVAAVRLRDARPQHGRSVPDVVRQAAAAVVVRVRALDRHYALAGVRDDQRTDDQRPADATTRAASRGWPGRESSTAERIDELYWTALARGADGGRIASVTCDYVDSAADRRQALEDIVWGLLNAQRVFVET